MSQPKLMREEFATALKVKNASDTTITHYIRAMLMFCEFLGHAHPLKATVEQIRAFLHYLLVDRKYAARSYNQILYGLKSFYAIFLPDVPIMDQFCRHKTGRRLVTVLTHEQVTAMIEVTTNIKHQAMIELLYGTGVRVGECSHLTIKDIDSKEMLVHIDHGKGNVERFVPLPKRALASLRNYARTTKLTHWLFPGYNPGEPITTAMIGHAVRTAARRANVSVRVTPHVLRHTFATHLLEAGYDIRTIQALMGHRHIKTTARYLHMRKEFIKSVVSPLDRIADKAAGQQEATHG